MAPPLGGEPMARRDTVRFLEDSQRASRKPSDDACDARIPVYGLFFKSDAGLKHSSPQQSRVKVRLSARREPPQISKKRASSGYARSPSPRLDPEPSTPSAGPESHHSGCAVAPRAVVALRPPAAGWRRVGRRAILGTSRGGPDRASRTGHEAAPPRPRERRTVGWSPPKHRERPGGHRRR